MCHLTTVPAVCVCWAAAVQLENASDSEHTVPQCVALTVSEVAPVKTTREGTGSENTAAEAAAPIHRDCFGRGGGQEHCAGVM